MGLTCHHACYALLTKELKYKLKLKDVQHLAGCCRAHLMGYKNDYGGILKYQDQAGKPLNVRKSP